jgi:hypothetical protein
MDKPLKPKPQFYAMCFPKMQDIARDMGYNLIIHGSLNRDMDLVAIPWKDEPEPEVKMIQALDMYLRGTQYDESSSKHGYMYSVLPGGRHSYVIHLNRGGIWNGYHDEQYYLDISFTPLLSIDEIGDLRPLLLRHPDQDMVLHSCLHYLGDEAQEW